MIRMRKNIKAQAILEFTFSMAAVVLLLAGMFRVFQWLGKDLVARKNAHHKILTRYISDHGGEGGAAYPLRQLRPTFFISTDIEGGSIRSDLFEKPDY